MTFSIVIPTYNGENFIKQALASALNQTYEADEVIISDDGSNDQTIERAKTLFDKYKREHHYHTRLIIKLNPDGPSGFVNSWNLAIRRTTGDFITILHQDDLLHNNYLEHIESALKKYPEARHIYTGFNYIDQHGEIIGYSPRPHLLKPVFYTGKEYSHNYLHGIVTNRHIHRCPGVTTSRALLLLKCTYRKEAGHIADDDFFLRVGAFTDVVGISYPLASYRLHNNSTSSRVDSLTLKLAEGYLFQVRYYLKPSKHLSKVDINRINCMAVRFVNLLLYEGLINNRRNWVRIAFALREELEELLPLFLSNHLPFWGKTMWAIATQDGNNLLAESYAKSLRHCIHMRDWLKNTTKLR